MNYLGTQWLPEGATLQPPVPAHSKQRCSMVRDDMPPISRGITATLLALAACSAPRKSLQTSPQPSVAITGNVAAAANAKADSNRFVYTEADVQFMSGMIHHHAQAIAMSKLAPTHGASSSVRILTDRI